MNPTFNVRTYGATGDGYNDDQPAFQAATTAAIACNGAVYIPPGTYLCDVPIKFSNISSRIAFFGDGQNVSVVLFRQTRGFDLEFAQSGAQQPFGATFRNMGIRALGKCSVALRIGYGVPEVSNDHNQPSCAFSNVQIVSDPEGTWTHGIWLQGAWNPTFENVFISGDSCGGNWNDMIGSGIVLEDYCVNAHLANVHCNFFSEGLLVMSMAGRNTEGIFCSNCSMVAVKRGVWVRGEPTGKTPRVSTLTWTGGLIELRVKGVKFGSAAFHLEHVWTALITGCQMITDTITENVENTYGVTLNECHGVVVSCCDLNAFIFGLATAGQCVAINTNGNTFTNTAVQTVFNIGTIKSRSYGHVLVNNMPQEWDPAAVNKIGFVN